MSVENTSIATPAAVTTAPAVARSTELPDSSISASRSAAIGATLLALSAGAIAATRVTTTPMLSAVTATPVVRPNPAVGMPAPIAPSTALSPIARPTPAPRPTTAAKKPIASASAATPASTWPRDAPIARSSAVSRVRWATTIAKVLWMLNVATSSAMPAKASRNVLKKPRKSASSVSIASSTSSCPVSASWAAGNSASTDERSCSSETPGSACRSTAYKPSGSPSRTVWAVSVSNQAKVTPPSCSPEPSSAIPTTSTSIGSGTRTVVASPTSRAPSSAAPLSITISPAATGARPSRRT